MFNKLKMKGHMPKCRDCPYNLGKIKCIVSPCPQCIENKSKKHPFPEAEIKEIKNEN